MSISGRITIDSTLSQAVGNFGRRPARGTNRLEKTLGTGANQANAIYVARLTITFGSVTTLDLRGGSLVALDGSTFSVASITDLWIVHRGTARLLRVGGGTNPLIPQMPDISAGGDLKISRPDAAGIAVTNGSNDNLRLETLSTGSIPVDVLIVGRSA